MLEGRGVSQEDIIRQTELVPTQGQIESSRNRVNALVDQYLEENPQAIVLASIPPYHLDGRPPHDTSVNATELRGVIRQGKDGRKRQIVITRGLTEVAANEGVSQRLDDVRIDSGTDRIFRLTANTEGKIEARIYTNDPPLDKTWSSFDRNQFLPVKRKPVFSYPMDMDDLIKLNEIISAVENAKSGDFTVQKLHRDVSTFSMQLPSEIV